MHYISRTTTLKSKSKITYKEQTEINELKTETGQIKVKKVHTKIFDLDLQKQTHTVELMQTTVDLKKLYETDEHLWLIKNAKLLREGHVDLVDFEHIVETLEEMGKRDLREIFSRMRVLNSHLLKWIYQKDNRGNSWNYTITEQRIQIKEEFEDSKTLENHVRENFNKAYSKARDLASRETGLPLVTFPEEPPFSFEEALDEGFLPE